MALSPNTVLQWSSTFQVRINSANQVEIRHPDLPNIQVSDWVLLIIKFTQSPITSQDLLNRLKPLIQRPLEWVQLTQTLTRLYEHGALTPHTAPRARRHLAGFAFPRSHIHMLNDHARTEAWLQAIAQTVTPEDVVLEIGTGSGILAMAAARAGAKHVYTIEATQIADIAQQNIERNGLKDRITLLRGLSTEIDLPERATVLVSEIIGSQPLGEAIIPYTLDALRRLLVPDARLIPQQIHVALQPAQMPARVRHQGVPRSEDVAMWHTRYGFDLTPLYDKALDSRNMQLTPLEEFHDWTWLGDTQTFLSVDLRALLHTLPPAELAVSLPITHAGGLDAFVVSTDIVVGDTVLHRLRPVQTLNTSWTFPTYQFFRPLAVQAGDTVQVDMSLTHEYVQLALNEVRHHKATPDETIS